MEINVCLYLRTCIFGLYMFIMILWKNDAYYSKSKSAQQNQDLQVGYGMWASGKWRRPTSCGISEAMNTSDVACAHLANDVDQRHATSAKAYTHQPWRVPIGWAT